MKEVIILDKSEFEKIKKIQDKISLQLTLALSCEYIYRGHILAVEELVNEMKDILSSDQDIKAEF